MNNEERTHRYAMMGVVSYVEERLRMFHKENDKLPGIVILGKLEWDEIMGCKLDEDFSVAGIPVVPDFTKTHGVYLT